MLEVSNQLDLKRWVTSNNYLDLSQKNSGNDLFFEILMSIFLEVSEAKLNQLVRFLFQIFLFLLKILICTLQTFF